MSWRSVFRLERDPEPLARGELLAFLLPAGLGFGLALGAVVAELYLGSAGRPARDGTALVDTAYFVRHVLFIVIVVGGPITLVGAVSGLTTAVIGLDRSRALQLMALGAGLAIVFAVLGEFGARATRSAAFRATATALEPLVDAIERAYRATGTLPHDLDRWADAGRATGPLGCRPGELRATEDGWELRYDCPNGFLSLDRFTYHSGRPEPVGPNRERMGGFVYFWD